MFEKEISEYSRIVHKGKLVKSEEGYSLPKVVVDLPFLFCKDPIENYIAVKNIQDPDDKNNITIMIDEEYTFMSFVGLDQRYSSCKCAFLAIKKDSNKRVAVIMQLNKPFAKQSSSNPNQWSSELIDLDDYAGLGEKLECDDNELQAVYLLEAESRDQMGLCVQTNSTIRLLQKAKEPVGITTEADSQEVAMGQLQLLRGYSNRFYFVE